MIVLTHGFAFRPFSAALRASRAAPTMTDGLEVLVQEVIAAHGVAIRTGHHCAWPAHRELEVQATSRASFYLYNTKEEVDALVEAIREARRFFGVEEDS